MVRITDFKSIAKGDGEKFYALVLQGGVEPIKSENTGRMYFTTRKATVPTTFDENTCKSVLGTTFEGEIKKVPCEPYEFTLESTGEILELTHRWEYVETGATMFKNKTIALEIPSM